MNPRISSIILSIHEKTKIAPNKLDILFGEKIKFWAENTYYPDREIVATVMINVVDYLRS